MSYLKKMVAMILGELKKKNTCNVVPKHLLDCSNWEAGVTMTERISFILTLREMPSRVGSGDRVGGSATSMVIIDLTLAGTVSTGFGPEDKTSQATGANNPCGLIICYELTRNKGVGRCCPLR